MNYIKALQTYRRREMAVYEHLDLESVNGVMQVLEEARRNGKNVFVCGNGGSAATASHFCNDFNKGVSAARRVKYNFECLSDNISTMMAVANDIGYDEIFRFPLRNKMKPGDVLIGISGSGNSRNVANAMAYARQIGGTTVALVGFDGGIIKEMADHCVHIEVDDMQIAEDLHLILNHMMMYALISSDGNGNE